MKSGWRVRRAQGRRRERLLQDFTGFPECLVQAGATSGPGTTQPETRGNAGLVQADRVDTVHASKSLMREQIQREASEDASVGGEASYGPLNNLDHLDHLDQVSNRAGSSGPGTSSLGRPPGPARRPWTDDRAWIAEIVRAEPGDPKMATLFWWVIAAGGWIEGTSALLPTLPTCMAKLELPRMLRQHRIEVREVESHEALDGLAEVMLGDEVT